MDQGTFKIVTVRYAGEGGGQRSLPNRVLPVAGRRAFDVLGEVSAVLAEELTIFKGGCYGFWRVA